MLLKLRTKHLNFKMIYRYLLNSRPYSWIDLTLLGLLAKFSVINYLSFNLKDVITIIGLLALWIFFNLILEVKHQYQYRGNVSVIIPIFFLLLTFLIGLLQNYSSIFLVLISVILVLLYLQKNRNEILGQLNSVNRGLIQVSYFLYALTFYSAVFSQTTIILAILIFLLYFSRGMVGDIRDIKHNAEANKKTFPVVFGLKKGRFLALSLLITSILIQHFYFGSYLIIIPLLAYAIGLIFYTNYYIQHQLFIFTTSFFSISMIIYFTSSPSYLILIELVYLGIILNMIFYPLLERKSNPIFIKMD
ncbi:MAG: UbiA family prenyltransferase [Patescibacteria group bacterium]